MKFPALANQAGAGDLRVVWRGDSEVKRRTFTHFGLQPDLSAKPLHDPLAHGQPKSATRQIASVETPKDTENRISILLLNSDTIVRNTKHEPIIPPRRRD